MGKVFESKTDKRLFFALFAIVGMIFLKKFVIIVINSSYDSHVKYFKFTENKEEQKLNEKVLIEFIANCFEEVSREFEIEYFGNAAKARIRGYHGDYWYSWVRAYEIRTPFMDKPFEVWIDNRTHKIFGSNFYDVLSYDDKFQHLYSEWVKKQVGIDDENVEIKFSRAMFHSRVIGDDISIDFSRVTSSENLMDQICESVKNIYIVSNGISSGITITMNDDEDIESLLKYADIIERKLHSRVFIYEYGDISFNSKKNILYVCITNKGGKDYIDLMYNYDDHSKFYRYAIQGSEWIKYE